MNTETTETTERITPEAMRFQLETLGFKLEVGKPYANVQKADTKDGKDWPNISFDVRLSFGGKLVIETPYRLGVRHVSPNKSGGVFRVPLTVDEGSLLHTWAAKPHAQFMDKALWAAVATKLAAAQKVVPTLETVLHSLLSDGEAFFNAQSFEDWAGDFGYDSDSRKAEAIYRACDSIGRKLSAVIPANVLAQAREIVRDL